MYLKMIRWRLFKISLLSLLKPMEYRLVLDVLQFQRFSHNAYECFFVEIEKGEILVGAYLFCVLFMHCLHSHHYRFDILSMRNDWRVAHLHRTCFVFFQTNQIFFSFHANRPWLQSKSHISISGYAILHEDNCQHNDLCL